MIRTEIGAQITTGSVQHRRLASPSGQVVTPEPEPSTAELVGRLSALAEIDRQARLATLLDSYTSKAA